MFSKASSSPKIGEYVGKTVERMILTGTRESSNDSSSSSNIRQKEARLIKIDTTQFLYSVVFLADGKHVVSGGEERKIRRWRVENGEEVGTPMNAGGVVYNIAVSRDGKWLIGGTDSGWVVWHAESHSKMIGFKGHHTWVYAVDVSPDGTKIATGSDDKTVCVWSLSTGKQLLGPFKHVNTVSAAKFSPDGRLIATATWCAHSVRVYDSQNGHFLVEFPIKVNSFQNQSLAWARDNKQLFVLSRDGNIHCLDVSTRKTLSRWRHDNNVIGTQCIALANNGAFIAASSLSSVSFWDTTTHKKIECVIHHTADISSKAISSDHDHVTAGGKEITIRNLRDVLPSPYCDDVSANVHCVR